MCGGRGRGAVGFKAPSRLFHYFTILRVKANIVQQITQRRHLETKNGKRNEKIIIFFLCVVLVLPAPSVLFHYFKGKEKSSVQQINKIGILSPK